MHDATHPLIPARMINELSYCPRLFHLEWVQREWADNYFTEDGRRVHRKVDHPRSKIATVNELPESRSVELGSEELGFIAKIDFVVAGENENEVVPLEFKRGSVPVRGEVPEPERVQLCVHALLLRAHGYEVRKGLVWYAESKRRIDVPMTQALRERTLELRDQARSLAATHRCPDPLVDDPKCTNCSLAPVCLPDEHNLLSSASSPIGARSVRAAHPMAMPIHLAEAGSVLRKDGDELVIEPRTSEAVRVRLIDVSSVVVHGNSKITTPAMHAILKSGVDISYLSSGGWLYGRTAGPWHKNVLVRMAQYRASMQPERSLDLAKRFVRAKITNCRVLLRRHGEKGHSAVKELEVCRSSCERAGSVVELLGIEGNAARIYFRGFAELLRPEETEFDFAHRNRRPPRDPINALLSLCYALLTTTWAETVSRVGFDPYLGFLHRPRHGRPALALDMMEEFRPIVADSVVMSLVRRRVVGPDHFIKTPTACALTKAGRKRVIAAYERRLEESIAHPVFGYKASYRRIFEIQARLLTRFLMDEIDHFPEFTTR